MIHTQLRRLIKKTSALLGSPWVILGVVFSAVIWIGVATVIDVPNTWRFMVSLCYSLLVLLICYALRHAQQQQMRAIERKLDEVMKAVEHEYAASVHEEQSANDTTIRMTARRKSHVPPYSLN
jgi:low affinity Fe/Cu permease